MTILSQNIVYLLLHMKGLNKQHQTHDLMSMWDIYLMTYYISNYIEKSLKIFTIYLPHDQNIGLNVVRIISVCGNHSVDCPYLTVSLGCNFVDNLCLYLHVSLWFKIHGIGILYSSISWHVSINTGTIH